MKAASVLTGGQALAGLLSAKVAALKAGVLKAMLLDKLKTALAVILVLGAVTLTCGVLSRGRLNAGAEDGPVRTPEQPAQEAQADQGKGQPSAPLPDDGQDAPAQPKERGNQEKPVAPAVDPKESREMVVGTVDLKESREIVVGTTRVVLLQVSRSTDFTDAADGKAPRAVTSVRIVYLLEYLGDKTFGPIEEGAEVFAAGTTDSAVRKAKTTAVAHPSYLKGAAYEWYRKREAESRPEQAVARVPKVKDPAKAQVIQVTFDDVDVTARKVDVRVSVGLHKGEENQRVLFRNFSWE